MTSDPKPGTLYLVGTPIGNLEDLSFRAVRILQEVDLIAAEDTRHTGKLLHHFQIRTPQLSYYEHNWKSRIPDVLHRLQQGQSIALVTDAGMPGISDPGYELVKVCAETAIPVIPIPGPSAAIAALVASGLPTHRFVFEGFLPHNSSAQRQQRLEQLKTEPRTLIFYEAPHRLRETLQALTIFGEDRPIALARELTKRYEEIWRGTIGGAIAQYHDREPQGEFTLVVAGASPEQPILSEAVLKTELQSLLNEGLSRSEASRQLAQQTDLPRRQIYQLALTLVEEEWEIDQ
jgi:16S rRNA (cytidine1402-2'-O)-methyltransferase